MAKTSKKPSYAPEIPERPKTKKSAASKKITVKSGNAKTKRKAVPAYEEDEEIIEVEAPKRGRAAKKTVETAKEVAHSDASEEQVNAPQPASSKRDLSIPYYERYLMTVEEASAYFHIGSKKMSSVIHEHPKAKWHLLSGNRRMIKRALFAQWLDEQQEI